MTNDKLREKQQQEAIARLEQLNLYPTVLKEFKQGLINVSEHGGILYWADEEQQAIIKEFEQEHEAIVYHIILSYTEIGRMLSIMYVSKYEEEWEMDRDDLKQGYPCVYVKNLDDDMLSEFGCIGIVERFGGLMRTA